MKTLVTLLLALLTLPAMAQLQEGQKDRIKAVKIAFLTERLDLSAEEAQKFWPIYNKYSDDMDELRIKERNEMFLPVNSLARMGEEEAGELLDNFIDIEEKRLEGQRKLIRDLRKTISSRRVLQLFKAEREFNKRMLQQLRGGRRNNSISVNNKRN